MIRPPLPLEIREKALALCRSGVTCRDVAERMNLPLGTVKAWRYREKKREALAQQQLAKVELAIVPAEPEEVEIPDLPTLPEKQEFFQEKLADSAVRLAAHVATLDGEQLVKSADKLLKATQTARASLKLDKEVNTVIQIGVLCQALPSMVQPQKALAE